jgi:MarR family transcriptional regulator, 2-MHQ and catechol-resistance regulon repressor
VGTHYRGPEGERRALDTLIKLVRATESLHGRLSGPMTEAGLTTSQFGALEALLHLGPMCQRDLGEKLLKSTGNITMVVDNLEKRGLARRVRDTEDRRYVTVHLTEEGERLIREVFPRHAAAVAAELSVLSPEEQEQLGRLCRKLGRGA